MGVVELLLRCGGNDPSNGTRRGGVGKGCRGWTSGGAGERISRPAAPIARERFAPFLWRRPQDAHRADPHRQDAMKGSDGEGGTGASLPGRRSPHGPPPVRRFTGNRPDRPALSLDLTDGSIRRGRATGPAPMAKRPNRLAEQEIVRAARDRRRWEPCGTSPIMRDSLPGFRLRFEAGNIPRHPTS